MSITPEVIRQHGLNQAEYAHIKELMGREPNLVELGIFSVMWSEHCSYKSTRAHLRNLPTKGPQVIQGPGENAGVVDIGDVYVRPGQLEESIERIADVVTDVARAGKVPIILGGDHTITWPDALGVARVHGFGEIALIHFDAHADTGFTQNGGLIGHGTPMRRLIESGAVPGHRFVQIGLRGYWPEPEVMDWMRLHKMRSFLMNEIEERGLNDVVDEAVAYSLEGGAKGVFISVDIDVVDPGLAPGTGTPEPGGLNSRQILDTVRRLSKELVVLGADIVEVSPPYDGPGEQTAYLANRVVLEILNGMSERKTGV